MQNLSLKERWSLIITSDLTQNQMSFLAALHEVSDRLGHPEWIGITIKEFQKLSKIKNDQTFCRTRKALADLKIIEYRPGKAPNILATYKFNWDSLQKCIPQPTNCRLSSDPYSLQTGSHSSYSPADSSSKDVLETPKVPRADLTDVQFISRKSGEKKQTDISDLLSELKPYKQ